MFRDRIAHSQKVTLISGSRFRRWQRCGLSNSGFSNSSRAERLLSGKARDGTSSSSICAEQWLSVQFSPSPCVFFGASLPDIPNRLFSHSTHGRIRAVTRSYQLLQVAVPALVALAVVGITHLLSVYRDRENKRREQRLGYLIAAFRALAKANHHEHLYEIADELEQAVADLQVFGTAEQVKLAQKFAEELGRTQHADIDELLNELRNSLRKELGREPITGKMCWMKITRKTENTR